MIAKKHIDIFGCSYRICSSILKPQINVLYNSSLLANSLVSNIFFEMNYPSMKIDIKKVKILYYNKLIIPTNVIDVYSESGLNIIDYVENKNNSSAYIDMEYYTIRNELIYNIRNYLIEK